MRDDVYKQALSLTKKTSTWQQLRSEFDKKGLTTKISPENMQELISFWHNKEAEKFTDKQLKDELEHWANGGSYETHLHGYNAVKPEALIENAKKRGWFVKEIKSGGFVINPPDSLPLRLKKIL